MEEGQRELDDSAQEVSEVLVEQEGLYSREDREGESLEDLFEPDLVAYPPIYVGHMI